MENRKDIFFSFDSFDLEIEKALTARWMPADWLMEALDERLKMKPTSEVVLHRIELLYKKCLVPLEKSKPNYLAHPIRVAAHYLDYLKDVCYEDMALALCHNWAEKTKGVVGGGYEGYLSSKVLEGIKILTIDREREKDFHYLKQYYARIGECGDLMLLKALDKLDNTFLWVLLDLEPYHSEVVLNYVCPRIALAYPKLERYLRELIPYVLDGKTKAKFRELISKKSAGKSNGTIGRYPK